MAKPTYNTAEDQITFNMLNPYVVDRLVRDGDIELPKKKVSIPKDEAWNTKQMTSKLLRGIQNGDSVGAIAKSLEDVIGNNRASQLRNARTMVTSAENHGRLDSYRALAAQGVVQKKEWMSTPDDRTRPSHVDIDGEEQDLDKPFSNGCMYPGDGRGPAEEVWMCRCTMTDHIVGFKRADGSISKIQYTRDSTLHDAQMKAERARRTATRAKTYVVKLGATGNRYTKKAQADLLQILQDNDSLSRDVYLNYVDQLKGSEAPARGKNAYYSAWENTVHLKPRSVAAGSSYETPFNVHFHEYAHNIDYIAGGGNPVSLAYRDAQGRTFEQIITSEWQKNLSERAMWNNFNENLDPSKGGVGPRGWIRQSLTDWRRGNGISRNDPRFLALKTESEKLQTLTDAKNFIKNNIDIFNSREYSISKDDVLDFCKEIKDKYSLRARSDISDMFERFSVDHGGPSYPFNFGHGKVYAVQEGRLAKETFAEMFAAEMTSPESLAVIKEYLPESYSAFQEMVRGLR